MKPSVFIAGIFVLSFCAIGCAEGDWLGPVERGLRGAMDGWDMWDTDAVRPYEDPMPALVPGTVPTVDRTSFQAGQQGLKALSPQARQARAARSYRRYCHHCHGQNGDGRIIVGESLDIPPADLRLDEIQSKSDRVLFDHLKSGGKLMVPLAATMTPLEMLLAIEHVRALKDRPTGAHFAPKHQEPLQ